MASHPFTALAFADTMEDFSTTADRHAVRQHAVVVGRQRVQRRGFSGGGGGGGGGGSW